MKLIDISPPLSVATAVWPGDAPLTRSITASMAQGDGYTASRIGSTVHLGAHADAPSHYCAGPTIDEMPLERYLGPCQLVDASNSVHEVGVEYLGQVPPGCRRVLFRTGSHEDKGIFNEDFTALSMALVEGLARAGVRLVGIDTPSVDRFEASSIPVHQACAALDLAIVEGLSLALAPPGAYELIALPLKLVGFDASPVRAVLRELDSTSI